MQTGSGVFFFRLEAQLHAELQITCVEGSSRLSERRVPNTVVELAFRAGQLEVGVIQDIEAFRSELELASLRNLEVLEERRIPVHITRASERVTAEGSCISGHRPLENAVVACEGILVVAEVSAPPVRPHGVSGSAEAGHGGIRTIIGLVVLVEVTTAARAVAERLPVCACVIRNGAIELPSADNRCQEPAVILEFRQLVNIIRAERVTDIEDRIGSVRPRHGLIAAIPFASPFMVGASR